MPLTTFAITADNKSVLCDGEGVAEIAITVSNTSAKPIRGQAQLKTEGATKAEWLSIRGDIERSFPPNDNQQFIARMALPPGTPQGTYGCRLYMFNLADMEKDWTQGPVVSCELRNKPIPATPRPPGPKWWLWLLLAAAVVAIAAGLYVGLKPTPLSAAFEMNESKGLAPLTVKFNNTTKGKFESILWAFGDGATDTNRDAEHRYEKPGAYVVSLLVTGKKRQSFATNGITVVQKAQAEFEVSPDSGPTPLKVRLVNRSTGDDLKWNWDFGNGSKSTDRDPAPQDYSGTQNYTITLTATGPDLGGATNRSVKTAVVHALAPSKANFTATPVTGESPLPVHFTDLSAGNPTAWRWDFGDGGSSTEKNPIHSYARVGPFNVNLRVSGPGGENTVTKNKLIIVSAAIRSVPLLVGKKLPDARNILAAAGLKVGNVRIQVFPPPIRMGEQVIGQNPAASTKVPAGSAVDLVVVP